MNLEDLFNLNLVIVIVKSAQKFFDYYILININFKFYQKPNCINDKTCRNRNCKKLRIFSYISYFRFISAFLKKYILLIVF